MSASARRRAHAPQDNQWALNKWLNLSQAYLVNEIGEERVNELVAWFRHAAKENESLWAQLYEADDPYRWLYDRARLTKPNRWLYDKLRH